MTPFQPAQQDSSTNILNRLPLLTSEKRQLPAKYRVYNRSREGFLSLEITVVDTTVVALKSLIDDLATKVNNALWLTPYRGLPIGTGVPSFDVVYLDEKFRVLQDVETYPSPNIGFLKFQPASALVLPVHTVFASRTQSGDQLEFRDASEPVEHGFRLVPGGQLGASQTIASQKSNVPAAVAGSHAEPAPKLQLAISRLGEAEAAEAKPARKDAWTRFMRWLIPDFSDRRRAGRHALPGLVAYHWTGATPQAYHLGNISDTGFFLLTDERPFPGTIILMTLQRIGSSGSDPSDSIAVHARVVRWGPDGVGLELLPFASADQGSDLEEEHKAFKTFYKSLHLPPAE